ncbi:MAG: DUF2306 domain-containing protein [Candidatus Nanopelagicales bacterium]
MHADPTAAGAGGASRSDAQGVGQGGTSHDLEAPLARADRPRRAEPRAGGGGLRAARAARRRRSGDGGERALRDRSAAGGAARRRRDHLLPARALQFAPTLRRRAWHRRSGRVVAPAGVVAALSGLWMAVYYDLPDSDTRAFEAIRLAGAPR